MGARKSSWLDRKVFEWYGPTGTMPLETLPDGSKQAGRYRWDAAHAPIEDHVEYFCPDASQGTRFNWDYQPEVL